MIDNNLALLNYSIGTLNGCIIAKKLSLDKLEEFAFDKKFDSDETGESANPEPKRPSLLTAIRHRKVVMSGEWDAMRMAKLSLRIDYLFDKGFLNPTSIAELCGTTVQAFQEAIDDRDEF